jgi:hypothetical protein
MSANDTSGCDDATITDACTSKHRHACANPHIVADRDWKWLGALRTNRYIKLRKSMVAWNQHRETRDGDARTDT